MNVLAFDPGGTTGWAFLSNGKIEAGSFHTWEEVWAILDQHHEKLDMVIIESFILRRGSALALSGSKLETVQVIGYIKAFCDNYVVPYLEQQPACKAIVVSKIKGLDVHAMDAVRHGLYYLKSRRLASQYREFLRRD